MDAKFMDRAIALAKEAAKAGEIPVGAVVVKDGKIVGEGKNEREEKSGVFAHAECVAIKNAAENLNDWRLNGCSIYVTLEPCMMCMGAVLSARISELVFGAFDPQGGAVEGDFVPKKGLPKIKIYSGIREEECKFLLKDFLKKRRNNE